MSDDRTFERNARAWLELGPTDAPDRVVEAALLAIESTSQERGLRIPWRFPTMSPITRIAAIAAVVVFAVGGALFAMRGSGPNVGSATTPPTIAPATSTPVPSPAGPALEAGIYEGPTLQVADLIAAINADPGLTALEKTQLINEGFAIKDKTTWSASIELRAGGFIERQTVDGVTTTGSSGTYTFPDARTIDLLDSESQSASRYAIVIDGDSFTLEALTPPSGAVDAFIVRTLFEQTFTLVR